MRWSPTPCCHHRATTAAAVPPLGGMRAVPSHDHHRRAPLPHTHMPCCCCDVCAITGWCAIKTHRQPVLLLLGMLLLPLVPPHSPALPHHHRRAHSRAPLPHTRMPCCGCDVCAIAWWSAQDAAAAARAAASTRSRTTTGAPTHARRRARSSSAHSLTSSTPSSQCSPTRSHRSCAPCVPSPPPSTPMHTCPLAPHSACTAEPTKSCRARVHVPRLTLCVPRHERRRICQCSVFSSCSPASRRL